MKTVLVTGSAGFVACHLIEHLFKNTDFNVVGIDRLDKHSDLWRVGEVVQAHPEWESRYKFVWADLRFPVHPKIAQAIGKVNAIFHLAASSHVDDSIKDPLGYAYDNVIGTVNILEYARKQDKLEYVHHFSTDECWGNAPEGVSYKEDDVYRPRNPYSAFKAGSDHVAYAYHITYNLPIIVSNCTNIYGEKQDTRKAIPLFIKKILAGEKISIHCYKGATKAGSRQFVHGRNVAAACLFLMENAIKGEKYNLPGQIEIDNLELAQRIAKIAGKELIYEMVDFHSDRPGHDTRYSLDGSKLYGMGFDYPVPFEESFEKCIKWYLDNQHWLK